MGYKEGNEVKADFNNVYIADTPHDYLATMDDHQYRIGENARPFILAAAQFLADRNGEAFPVQMLDIGCSYGIGSALLRYGCSFDEIVSFFGSRAPVERKSCCDATRMWLNVVSPLGGIRCAGLDCSKEAIDFAVKSGLLDFGISKNLENGSHELSKKEKDWISACNLMVSTGAIGYVTQKTLRQVLDIFGNSHPSAYGPFAVLTILRMFDDQPIQKAFESHGYAFGRIPGIYLHQRQFVDDKEREDVLSILSHRQKTVLPVEEKGGLYAGVYIAGRPDQFSSFKKKMEEVREGLADIDKANGHGYVIS